MGLIKQWIQNTVSRRGFIVMFGLGLYQFVFKKYAEANTLYLRVNEFQIRSIEDTQHVDLKTWRLRIEGLVEKGLFLRFDEIQALPKKTLARHFQCVEGWGLDDQKW